VSEPLPSDVLPFLHFAISGGPGLDASLLHLETSGGIASARAFPLRGSPWHATDVAVPAGSPVRIVAEIPAGSDGFSFTEPVEMGAESWLDHWLLRRSLAVEAAAGVLFALLLSAVLIADLRDRSPPNAAA
jgi:hypothetical protein